VEVAAAAKKAARVPPVEVAEIVLAGQQRVLAAALSVARAGTRGEVARGEVVTRMLLLAPRAAL
jgi:hypothetical protein